MTQPTNCNGDLRNANSFLSRLIRTVNERRVHLSGLLRTGAYEEYIRHAGRYAGLRPSWHLEKGLLRRVISAGLGKYVREFGFLEAGSFSEQLLKGEKLMTTPAHFKGDYRRLVNAACTVKRHCKFPDHKFSAVSVTYAAENQVNRRSSAGFPFFRRKGYVMDQLIKQATELFELQSQHIWDWPCTRGFRIQIRESLGELARKIRLMYPYPGALILIEDCFIIPFVKHFIDNDTFYVIGRNGGDIGRLIKSRFDRPGVRRITGLDVSSFDQNMVNEAIILAFWIIRSQLSLTKNQSIVFEQMVSYFCTGIMVSREPGKSPYAFLKTHGVPSGSGFTNMIDTLAHAIVFEYLQPGILEKCLICGDDNIFDSTGLDLTKLYVGYEQIFNLPISLEKTESYSSWRSVYFLGFKFLNGIRYISPLLAINQILWHTDFFVELSEFDRTVARSASVLLNGINGKMYFERLFPDIMHSLDMGIDIRFQYLYGYAPPTTSKDVLSIGRGYEPGINSSLLEHLSQGWAIR